MKKSELKDAIKQFVEYEYENYSGADLHQVIIPSDRYEGVYIVGHFAKRGIGGVSVAIDVDGEESYGYDVTNRVIEHDSEHTLFKESYFIDVPVAIESMYDTILSARDNITELLDSYTINELMTRNNPTRFPVDEGIEYMSF